ncbi:hypothetical protein NVP1259O_23 [Vibrio phage 1.259.O._10N.286.48.F4]|nr:hypothetical protein NVP1259O_23 [Vibrio phage 1.259.O._10N.286.48.F4]
MAEITISELRNLEELQTSLLFAVDGDAETFNVSLSTIYEYILDKKGDIKTGCIEMYTGEIVPNTHTELDGKTFDPLIFPMMGALFPSGVLPDTRGMVLKHAPDGRSVLSFEDENIKSHSHSAVFSNGVAVASGEHDHGVYVDSKSDLGAGARSALSPSENTPVRTDEKGLHTHQVTGNVTINASGSAKNLVDNIAVKFIIKKA